MINDCMREQLRPETTTSVSMLLLIKTIAVKRCLCDECSLCIHIMKWNAEKNKIGFQNVFQNYIKHDYDMFKSN